MIYFDYNATTPLCPEALRAMGGFVSRPGNPSSQHQWGRKARVALDLVRGQIRTLVGATKAEVVFTSGGTEGDHLALHGWAAHGLAEGRSRIVFGKIEHPAILGAARQLEAQGFEVVFARVLSNGEVDVESVRPYCDEKLAVLAVMLANNETGVIQPVRALAELAKAKGAMVHCDGVQGTGKIPLHFDSLMVDSFALSAHKFGGPKGIGAVVMPKGSALKPLWSGGGQEGGIRPGSEATALVVGMGAAAQEASRQLDEGGSHFELRDAFEEELKEIPNITIVGKEAPRLPTTSSVCFHGRLSYKMVEALDQRGICVSGGSACHSGGPVPSDGMLSLGMSPEDASATVRFSFGSQSTREELDVLLKTLIEVAASREVQR